VPADRLRTQAAAPTFTTCIRYYIWALSSVTPRVTPGWQPELAAPGLSSAHSQAQQSLHATYQQIQQQLQLLHQQVQQQIALNPYSAPLQLNYFQQEVQQMLQAAQWRAQQHLLSLLQIYARRQLKGQQWAPVRS
jgi:hypothetical protein